MANDDNTRPRATGGCLCGSVRFEVRGPLRDVVICHCVFCQRMHTHVGAATACAPSDLRIISGRTLRWYRSSPMTRRGFCSRCGAQLFAVSEGHDHTSIMASTIDEPTGLRLVKHVCVSRKGDYYEITDGLPQQSGRAMPC